MCCLPITAPNVPYACLLLSGLFQDLSCAATGLSYSLFVHSSIKQFARDGPGPVVGQSWKPSGRRGAAGLSILFQTLLYLGFLLPSSVCSYIYLPTFFVCFEVGGSIHSYPYFSGSLISWCLSHQFYPSAQERPGQVSSNLGGTT